MTMKATRERKDRRSEEFLGSDDATKRAEARAALARQQRVNRPIERPRLRTNQVRTMHRARR